MVEIKRKNNATWVTLASTLDVGNVVELKNGIKKAVNRKPPFVIDASNVARLHGAAIQVLLAFTMLLREKEHDFRWHEASDQLLSASRSLGLIQKLGLTDE